MEIFNTWNLVHYNKETLIILTYYKTQALENMWHYTIFIIYSRAAILWYSLQQNVDFFLH